MSANDSRYLFTKRYLSKERLSFESVPVPLYMLTNDGSMTPCVKSDSMHNLKVYMKAMYQLLGQPTTLY